MHTRVTRLGLLCALGFTVLPSGCATMFQGGPDRIPVDSNPKGATVYLDGQPVGQTPTVVSVPRDSEARITVEAPGYAPVTVDRDKVLAGWFLGNLLWGLGAVIAMPIDLATHNQGKYTEEPITVALSQGAAVAEVGRQSVASASCAVDSDCPADLICEAGSCVR